MIESLLPLDVKSAVIMGEDRIACLYPEEVAQLEPAVESRKREFAAGR